MKGVLKDRNDSQEWRAFMAGIWKGPRARSGGPLWPGKPGSGIGGNKNEVMAGW